MKKTIAVAGICAFSLLAGCANNDSANQGMHDKSGSTLNVNNKRSELYQEGGNQSIKNVSNQYGYVRQQKSPVMNDNKQFAALNREQLANIISRLSTALPNVHDVATLVTDQEVLIAYRSDTNDRNQTADQVKKTAMSVVPRYYHVYVTDNKNLIRDVENLSHLGSTSKNVRTNVNQLIAEMKKSPQGLPINASENPNGETADDNITRPMQ